MKAQINRVDWPAFADQFSLDNQGRFVSIETVGQGLGGERLAENIPLMAVDFDPENQGTILITVNRDDEIFTHTIAAPKAIWLEGTEDGKALALEVVAADGSRTLLRFED